MLLAGVGVQVPFVPCVHDSHGPSQAVLQHTCSRLEHMSPVWHWLVDVQAPPAGSSPHELPMQVAFGAHAAGPHVALQVVPPHV